MTTDTRKPIPPVLNAKMVRRDGEIETIESINFHTGVGFSQSKPAKTWHGTGAYGNEQHLFDLMSIYVEPKHWFEVFLDEVNDFLNGLSPQSDLLVIYNKARAAYDTERKK